jgi:hypothetical protein
VQIPFGASVFGSDGNKLGEVEGLVVDAGTKRARAILVDQGWFSRGQHMVAISAVSHGDTEGVHLDTSGPVTESEAPFVESIEVAKPQRVEPPTTFIEAAGVGGPVIADEPPPPGEYPNSSSFFDIAPIDPPPVEIESDLEENEVLLGRRTDAVSSDGHRLGEVVQAELGDMGLVEAVTVSEGIISREHATFKLSDIDEFGTNKVHLRLTRAQAEAH